MSAEPQQYSTHEVAEPRRRVDLLTLLAGIGTLLVAGYILGDGPSWMSGIDLRWLLAGAAAVAGIGLLASSLRKPD